MAIPRLLSRRGFLGAAALSAGAGIPLPRLAASSSSGNGPAPGRLAAVTASTPFSEGGSDPWRYLLYLPGGYDADPERRWPMLIWLHGRSVVGGDLSRVRRYGPPSFLGSRRDFPFVTVCPHLPRGAWPAASLHRLLDEWLALYRIDEDRVCLSGVSLGAAGAWTFAASRPERFAALVPVAASGPRSAAARLGGLPVWAFHGARDSAIPVGPHRDLVESVKRNGGDARITVYPEGTHGSVIQPVYRREDLYEWMLAQRRGERAPSDLAAVSAEPGGGGSAPRGAGAPSGEAAPEDAAPASVTVRPLQPGEGSAGLANPFERLARRWGRSVPEGPAP